MTKHNLVRNNHLPTPAQLESRRYMTAALTSLAVLNLAKLGVAASAGAEGIKQLEKAAQNAQNS